MVTFCDAKEKGVKRGWRVFTRFRLNGSDIIHLTVRDRFELASREVVIEGGGYAGDLSALTSQIALERRNSSRL